jgi:hypothetical protein
MDSQSYSQARHPIKKAAIIAGISRTTLYKDYLETGKISKKADDRGKPYIEFGELCRVFGLEKCLDGLHKIEPDTKEQEDTVHNQKIVHPLTQQENNINTHELIELRIREAKLEGEIDKLKALMAEKENRLQEKDSIIQNQKERINGLEVRYDRLLEDTLPKQAFGFWARLKKFLPG